MRIPPPRRSDKGATVKPPARHWHPLLDLMEPRWLFSTNAGVSTTVALPALAVYQAPSSNPALPAGVDTFTPPASTLAATAGAPTIAVTNVAANPNDTLSITGSSFTSDAADDYADTQFLVYGQTTASNGTLTTAQLQGASSAGALATISASEPANSMYLVWPENSSGAGAPVAINQTQSQWLSPNVAAASATVSVYGRNLTNGSGQSWVYLQPAAGTGQWVAVTDANPYRVQFTMPATITAGASYQVWVYNGMGGEYGWSAPLTITASKSQTFSGTVNVTTYGATGNGTTDDGPAILKAIKSLTPDETLYFPAGTYRVAGEQIILPSNVRLLGDSQTTSVIRFDGAVPASTYGTFEIGVTDPSYASNIDFQSIGLTYNGPVNNTPAMVRERNAVAMTFNHVALISNSLTAIDWEGSGGVALTNSTVISNGIYINATTQITFNNDLLLQDADKYGQAGVTFDNSNAISVTNCTTENYYDYELSVNPNQPYDLTAYGEGRFLEFDAGFNVYIASNTSVNLGESTSPADHNSGEQFNVEGSRDLVYGAVVSATSNTFTLAGSQSLAVLGLEMSVISGSGAGQQLSISAATYNSKTAATTYTVSKNFTVIPSAGNTIDIANAPRNFVFYKNTLNHTTGANASQDQASTGFEFFEGGSGIVIDSNTVNNTRTGVSLSSYGVHVPVSSVDIINNTFNGIQTGISLAANAGTDPGFIATAVRANTIAGVSTAFASTVAAVNLMASWQIAPITLSVFEHNTYTGFTTTMVSDAASDIFADDSNSTASVSTSSGSTATAANASAGTTTTQTSTTTAKATANSGNTASSSKGKTTLKQNQRSKKRN